MNGLSLGQILVHGIILSIGGSMIILGGMYLNPRIMLRSYPKEIKAQVPPLTDAEKNQTIIMAILAYGFMLGVIFYSNAQVAIRAGDAEFLPIFLNTYLVFEVFNLFDLLILDYLVTMILKPKALFIPGVEGMEQYNTFRHHFRGFLIGLIIGVVLPSFVLAVPIARSMLCATRTSD